MCVGLYVAELLLQKADLHADNSGAGLINIIGQTPQVLSYNRKSKILLYKVERSKIKAAFALERNIYVHKLRSVDKKLNSFLNFKVNF